METNNFKYDEIKAHAVDWLLETKAQAERGCDYDFSDTSDVHNDIFNTEYYIIGRQLAKEWLGDHAFEAIGVIKQYEQNNFGEVFCDFSDPEEVVNMYTFIVGGEILESAMIEAGVKA